MSIRSVLCCFCECFCFKSFRSEDDGVSLINPVERRSMSEPLADKEGQEESPRSISAPAVQTFDTQNLVLEHLGQKFKEIRSLSGPDKAQVWVRTCNKLQGCQFPITEEAANDIFNKEVTERTKQVNKKTNLETWNALVKKVQCAGISMTGQNSLIIRLTKKEKEIDFEQDKNTFKDYLKAVIFPEVIAEGCEGEEEQLLRFL